MAGTMSFRCQTGFSRVNVRVDLLVGALNSQAGLSAVSWSLMKCNASQQALHDLRCPEPATRFPASSVGICLYSSAYSKRRAVGPAERITVDSPD